MKVVYVNHGISQQCGVYDFGVRHAAAIGQAPDVDVRYMEIDNADEYRRSIALCDPDAVIINYAPVVMPWFTPVLRAAHPVQVAVVQNFQHETIGHVAAAHRTMFSHVLVCDPTLETDHPAVLVTDRPLPTAIERTVSVGPIRIGSFGFAFPHKGFADVAKEIQAAHVHAVYDLHMPEAFFNGASGQPVFTHGILQDVRNRLGSKNELHYTNDLLEPDELVARLEGNHVNCLFYAPGQPNAGISSALDYLIAARRPILVTDCAMFRHAAEAVSFFPAVRLVDVLADYGHHLNRIDACYAHRATLIAAQTAAHLRRIVA